MDAVRALLTASALAVCACAAAAGGAAAQTPPPAPCGPAAAHPARFYTFVTADGVRRRALVNVPPHAAGTPLPLVLAFHGAGATGRFMETYTGLSRIADRAGFVAVYPYAHGPLWNSAGRGPQPEDDVEFVRLLLGRVEAMACIDASRVYATGVSNGGSFTARIGCELSDLLSAIAPVAGGYGVQPACTPSRAISVLEIHGTDDGAVPYDGTERRGGGVPRFLSMWAGFDGCAPGTVWRRLAPRTLLEALRGCASGAAVKHVKIIGGPHAWPGSAGPEARDRRTRIFSASQAIWQFFSSRSVTRAAVLDVVHAR